MTISNLGKNIASSATITILDKVSAFLLVVLIARFLGVEQYGHYAFAVAFTSFFSIFSELGLNGLLVRELTQKPSTLNLHFKHALALRCFSSAIALFALLIVCYILDFESYRIIELLLVGGIVLVKNITDTLFSVFRASLIIHHEAISTLFERVITLLGGVSILLLGFGLTLLLSFFLFAKIMQFVFSYFMFRKLYKFSNIPLSWSLSKKLLSQAWPFLGLNFMMAINYRIDSIFLTSWRGDVATGYYNAAYNLIFGLTALQVILGKVTFPIFSKFETIDRGKFIQSYQRTIKFTFVILIPVVLGAFFYSNEIIRLVYGSSFVESSQILGILIWALPFMYLSSNLGSVITVLRGEKMALYAWLFCALLNVALNFYAVPRLGYIGASITTVVSEAFLALAYTYLVAVRLRFPVFNVTDSIRLAALGGLVLCVLYFVKSLEMILGVTILLFIYSLATFSVKIFSNHDVMILRNLVSTKH